MTPSPDSGTSLSLQDIELTSAPSKVLGGSDPDLLKPTSLTIHFKSLCKRIDPPKQQASLLKSSIGGQFTTASPAASPAISSQESPAVSGQKIILSEVSGTARSGEIMALMGPSGSGKTTLLDCLSNRGIISSGSIALNGEPLSKKHKRSIAYVMQQDIFFEHLTVRDQLVYTALLRLPDAQSTQSKMAEVDKVISQLKLEKCANTPIMLISGGERKRTNIGSELLTDPQAILLDEPTSGLDSTSAVALMNVLRTLADSGKTVITSIHQPSSSVFASFDNLLVLADGCIVYAGTPGGSLAYFESLNYPCPNGYNASDHLMDLLVVDAGVDESNASRKQRLIDKWDSGKSSEDVAKQIEQMKILFPPSDETDEHFKKWNTSYLTQLKVLMHRAMRNSRSAIFTPLNFVKSIVLGLISGLVWFQLPEGEKYVADRSGLVFFNMTFWVFDSLFTAFMSFPSERELIFKERSSGSYRLSAYFIAKTISEAPMRLALPFSYILISYWMSNLNSSVSAFFPFVLVQLLCVLAGESIGLLVGATVLDMEKAMVVATLISLAMMLTGGFFAEHVAGYIGWVQYLSPFKYSYHACLQIAFDSDVKCDGSGALENLCKEGVEYAARRDVLDMLGAKGSVLFNVFGLFVISIAGRIAAYAALRRTKDGGGRV